MECTRDIVTNRLAILRLTNDSLTNDALFQNLWERRLYTHHTMLEMTGQNCMWCMDIEKGWPKRARSSDKAGLTQLYWETYSETFPESPIWLVGCIRIIYIHSASVKSKNFKLQPSVILPVDVSWPIYVITLALIFVSFLLSLDVWHAGQNHVI